MTWQRFIGASTLVVAASAAVPAVSGAQGCDKVGAGSIFVCKVVGTRCSPPTNGVCATVVQGRNDSDCLCVVEPPGGLHAQLVPVGPVPNAAGAAYVDNIAGEMLVAIGVEGLAPFQAYLVSNHLSGDCFDGGGTLIAPFHADVQGKAGIVDDISSPTVISIRNEAGMPILCGSLQPIATMPWSFGGVKFRYR